MKYLKVFSKNFYKYLKRFVSKYILSTPRIVKGSSALFSDLDLFKSFSQNNKSFVISLIWLSKVNPASKEDPLPANEEQKKSKELWFYEPRSP